MVWVEFRRVSAADAGALAAGEASVGMVRGHGATKQIRVGFVRRNNVRELSRLATPWAFCVGSASRIQRGQICHVETPTARWPSSGPRNRLGVEDPDVEGLVSEQGGLPGSSRPGAPSPCHSPFPSLASAAQSGTVVLADVPPFCGGGP